MKRPHLALSVTAPSTPVLLGGPMPVVVTVTNGSTRPIEIDLAYPNLLYLRFTSASATARDVPVPPSVLGGDTHVAPGAHATVTYYVNRYLRFDAPGEVRVGYRLVVPVRPSEDDPGGDLAASGELAYTISKADDDALREQLSNAAVGLKSADDHVKAESAEALAFLETPLAAEYQARMVTIDHLEVMGIQALGRSSSTAARALVVEVLGKGDADANDAAFEVLDRMGDALPRERVLRRLADADARVRETALALLRRHPDPRDRPALERVLDDPSTSVREQARAYAESLRR